MRDPVALADPYVNCHCRGLRLDLPMGWAVGFQRDKSGQLGAKQKARTRQLLVGWVGREGTAIVPWGSFISPEKFNQHLSPPPPPPPQSQSEAKAPRSSLHQMLSWPSFSASLSNQKESDTRHPVLVLCLVLCKNRLKPSEQQPRSLHRIHAPLCFLPALGASCSGEDFLSSFFSCFHTSFPRVSVRLIVCFKITTKQPTKVIRSKRHQEGRRLTRSLPSQSPSGGDFPLSSCPFFLLRLSSQSATLVASGRPPPSMQSGLGPIPGTSSESCSCSGCIPGGLSPGP